MQGNAWRTRKALPAVVDRAVVDRALVRASQSGSVRTLPVRGATAGGRLRVCANSASQHALLRQMHLWQRWFVKRNCSGGMLASNVEVQLGIKQGTSFRQLGRHPPQVETQQRPLLAPLRLVPVPVPVPAQGAIKNSWTRATQWRRGTLP